MPNPTNDLEIKLFFSCQRCLEQLPAGESPESYARFSVGFTPNGFQVWCLRHDCNVINMDFEGHKHPANTTRNIEHLEVTKRIQ